MTDIRTGSIDGANQASPAWPELKPEDRYRSVETAPLEPPAEGELNDNPFERQARVAGHVQDALSNPIVLVGAGGLNSWIGLGLMRSGARHLTIIDPDFVDRTNLSRQFYYGGDLGKPKGPTLASNLSAHAIAAAHITGIAMYFQEAIERYALPCELLVVGVDNNRTRLDAARFARGRRIPAVFIALSKDGMRLNAFLQGRWAHDPCWHCAQPNLDPDAAAPCVPAIISTCLLVAGVAVFMCHRALMGWPDGVQPYNWRDSDLLGCSPEIVGTIRQRQDCPTCRGEK